MIRQSRWLATGLLCLLLAAAPLPFGSVVPWAAASVVVLALLAAAAALVGLESQRVAVAVAVPTLALLLLGLYGWLQALPLPAGLVGALSPAHAELYAASAPLLPLEAPAPHPSLSLAPSVSRTVGLALIAAAGAFLAASVVGHSRRRRRLLVVALGVGTLVPLLYGVRLWLERRPAIWGIEVLGDSSRLRGTFVNPNHFALWLEIALAVAFAAAWWALRRARWELRLEHRLLLAVPPVLLWLGLFATLAFTGSRAGLAALALGLAAQGLALAAARRTLRPLLWVLALAVAGGAFVAATGWREGIGRWLAASGLGGGGGRREVYAASYELLARFPVFGSGLGTFREAFPLVQPPTLPGTWWHAHSDLLELVLTAGVVGTAVALLGLWSLLRRLLAVIARGARSEDRAAGLAALGALVAVAAHEAVDFGLTMPANAFALVIVLGAACGAELQAQRPKARRETGEVPQLEVVDPRREGLREGEGSVPG